MSEPLDLDAIEARRVEAVDYYDGCIAEAWAETDGAALIAEVKRLRGILDYAQGAIARMAAERDGAEALAGMAFSSASDESA